MMDGVKVVWKKARGGQIKTWRQYMKSSIAQPSDFDGCTLLCLESSQLLWPVVEDFGWNESECIVSLIIILYLSVHGFTLSS